MKMLSDIAKEALELSSVQRRILARILLDLSDDDQDFSPDVDAAWEEEISRRLHRVKAGRAQSRTLAEVFSELDRRFPS
jgi:Putative addiction module component